MASLVMTVPIRSAWLAGSAQPGLNLDFDIDLDFNLADQTRTATMHERTMEAAAEQGQRIPPFFSGAFRETTRPQAE